MRWFKPKEKFSTTLPVTHPMNYLGTPADPVVMYLPIHGQVMLLVPAPAPAFLSNEDIYTHDRKLYALQDVDVIPSAYYKRDEPRNGYVRAG